MVHEDLTGCDVRPPNPFSFPFDFLTRAEKRVNDEQDLGMSVHSRELMDREVQTLPFQNLDFRLLPDAIPSAGSSSPLVL